MNRKNLRRVMAAAIAFGAFLQAQSYAVADTNQTESVTTEMSEPKRSAAVLSMKRGAQMMIEGRKMIEQKGDLASAEGKIKDGHRMMMDAEKTVIKVQNDLMRKGARRMMEGLQILKSRKDADAAEKLMAQGENMIAEAERMMSDTQVEKMMHGSRTMMRGLRMRHEKDLQTSDKSMTEGGKMMIDASQMKTDDK